MHRLFLAAAIAVAPAAAIAQTARDNIDALIEQQQRPTECRRASCTPSSSARATTIPTPRAAARSASCRSSTPRRAPGLHGRPSGLYDPETNLRYGVAYLAGLPHRAGQPPPSLPVLYRGYYYAAKRQGIPPSSPRPWPPSPLGQRLASLFTGRRPRDGPGLVAWPMPPPSRRRSRPWRCRCAAPARRPRRRRLRAIRQPDHRGAAGRGRHGGRALAAPPPDALAGTVQVAAATPAASPSFACRPPPGRGRPRDGRRRGGRRRAAAAPPPSPKLLAFAAPRPAAPAPVQQEAAALPSQ